MKKLRLMPNTMVVEIENVSDEIQLGIVLPQRVHERKGRIGRVVQSCLAERSHKLLKGHTIDGKRVLLAAVGGFNVGENRYIYPTLTCLNPEAKPKKRRYESTILAILPDGVEAELEGEDKRCRFCGPAKSGSKQGILMVSRQLHADEGDRRYTTLCPRCGKDLDGRKVD